MPNIIINNYCNQKCSYCFAHKNMAKKELQKDIKIITYLEILKYLKNNNDNYVRILWWEPFLSPNIKQFLSIANKGWFNIVIFSNINIKTSKLENILSGMQIFKINCNINEKSFYSSSEKNLIQKNIELLNKLNITTIISHNITQTEKEPDFIFELAKKNNIKNIGLKITNSQLWWKLIIDNSSKELWQYIFKIIKKYHNYFFISISCWLDKSIFTKEELLYIEEETNIELNFWCEWNMWKFDINTDGSIFKCYPLEKLFNNKKYKISNLLNQNIKLEEFIKEIGIWLNCKWECRANKIIKEK